MQRSNPGRRDRDAARSGMRLNQYLASCGVGSRRHCDAIIRAGRVRVDGQVAALALRVGANANVEVDGIAIRPPQAACVWMLHKPAGVVSTARDTHGRATVIDLARRAGIPGRVFPVGRLDRDTTGLLLLTNDGDLCFRLTHPAWGVEKEYEATVAQPLAESLLATLDECLGELTDRARQALIMRFRQQQSRAAIAASLGLSEDGAKNLMQRAKQQLRVCIERKLG